MWFQDEVGEKNQNDFPVQPHLKWGSRLWSREDGMEFGALALGEGKVARQGEQEEE